MPNRLLGLLAGGLLLVACVAAVPASAATPKVTVRVEGQSHTLLAQRAVSAIGAPVVKDGNASHSCPGNSAAGALERATAGNWTGSWFAGSGYFVTGIKGETHSGATDYWSFWVNNRMSSTGICQAPLHRGDSILFFVAPVKGQVLPLGLRVAHRARRNQRVTVTVVRYSTSGKAAPVRGAVVRRFGKQVGRTDRHGHLRLRFARRGLQRLTASKTGFVRSAAVTVNVRP